MVTPFPKTDPGNMRESSRPVGPERIRHEEATWCGTDRSAAAASGRGFGERGRRFPRSVSSWGSASRRTIVGERSTAGMDPQMARQLQELQKENARLKRLVADQALDNQILREAARPNW